MFPSSQRKENDDFKPAHYWERLWYCGNCQASGGMNVKTTTHCIARDHPFCGRNKGCCSYEDVKCRVDERLPSARSAKRQLVLNLKDYFQFLPMVIDYLNVLRKDFVDWHAREVLDLKQRHQKTGGKFCINSAGLVISLWKKRPAPGKTRLEWQCDDFAEVRSHEIDRYKQALSARQVPQLREYIRATFIAISTEWWLPVLLAYFVSILTAVVLDQMFPQPRRTSQVSESAALAVTLFFVAVLIGTYMGEVLATTMKRERRENGAPHDVNDGQQVQEGRTTISNRVTTRIDGSTTSLSVKTKTLQTIFHSMNSHLAIDLRPITATRQVGPRPRRNYCFSSYVAMKAVSLPGFFSWILSKTKHQEIGACFNSSDSPTSQGGKDGSQNSLCEASCGSNSCTSNCIMMSWLTSGKRIPFRRRKTLSTSTIPYL
ncbi:hypothetical protein DL98DRAFT_637329 [Cadophora sp. DSE1049]|nr:hypothetical protein DL98DRAFT_637329 [Cadophora sp. DSE1049]